MAVGGRARGIDGGAAEAGACTDTVPPARLTATDPLAPSFPFPVRMTVNTRSLYARAADASTTSMDGWAPRVPVPPACSSMDPGETTALDPGGTTWIRPVRSGVVPSMAMTG